MGVADVKLTRSIKQLQVFEKHILNDIHAMDKMLKKGLFDANYLSKGL